MQILFRLTPWNRYTLPLLLHLVEEWDSEGDCRLDTIQSLEEAEEALRGEGPTLLAYSFMTTQIEEIAEEVRMLRPLLGPKDLLVAGGPHPSADPLGTLKLGFDVVIAGEAEDLLPSFLKTWKRNIGPRNLIRIWRTTKSCSLDKALPFSKRLQWVAPLEISRGCPYRCGYCFTPRLHVGPVRHRKLASVVEYLDMSRKMGRTFVRFIAPDAFSYRDPNTKGGSEGSLRRLLELCKKMGFGQIHLGSFPSEVRPDRVREGLLELIRSYCANRKLVIGAQSGSDRLLKAIGRGHTAAQVERAVRTVTNFGFLAHVDMLFGLPGETPTDRYQSLRLMERLLKMGRTKIHAHVYLPLPGTPLFRLPPSPLKPDFLKRLQELQSHGALDGDWETQLHLQEKILMWRRMGLIRAKG